MDFVRQFWKEDLVLVRILDKLVSFYKHAQVLLYDLHRMASVLLLATIMKLV